jgi:hypothetical protein
MSGLDPLMKKMFDNISIEDENHLSRMEERLTSVRQLSFSIGWTPNCPVILYKLHLECNGVRKNCLTQTVNDTDGEITLYLGGYGVGQHIKISFGVYPLVDVPKAKTFLIGDSTILKTNPSHPDEFQKLEVTKVWDSTIEADI